MTEKPESQFGYVVIASRRARQLQAGARALLEHPRSRKSTRIAMEELDKGLLQYEVPEPPDGSGKDGKRKRSEK